MLLNIKVGLQKEHYTNLIMVFSIPSKLPVNRDRSWGEHVPWLLITGLRLLGVPGPGPDAGLLNGRVGLTRDGENARFILDVPHYSVKKNRKISNYACSHYSPISKMVRYPNDD